MKGLKSHKNKDLLIDLGMKVNTDKAAIVIFSKQPQTDMKVLGVIFDRHLKWEAQVKQVVNKCTSKLLVPSKIRHKFDIEQFLKIVTSQYYSQFYYFSPLWLSRDYHSK